MLIKCFGWDLFCLSFLRRLLDIEWVFCSTFFLQTVSDGATRRFFYRKKRRWGMGFKFDGRADPSPFCVRISGGQLRQRSRNVRCL